jgi:hypothetical protein
MNLRAIRSADKSEPKPASNSKAPHAFQEAVPGVGVCALCSQGKSDPRHIVAEENESPKWGFA